MSQWPRPKEEIAYWKSMWEQAILNMPALRNYTEPHTQMWRSGLTIMWGQPVTLGKLLGYTSANSIYNAWLRGSRPTEKRKNLLLKFAGTNGTFLARIALTNLGVNDKYKYWPK